MGNLSVQRLVRATVTAGEFTPALVTIPNVELLEVGEDWETSTGEFTWDEADLLSAIECQVDPAIRTPVIKLGHIDPRFDGQPAFGRIINMRLTNNYQTLVGDLVGVPAWLASIMPTAYPRRSIEGYFDYCAPGPAGSTKWPFVLTGLALLGDAYPAINTLEDLQILWGEEPPPLEPVEDVQELVAASESTGFIRAMRRADMVSWLKTKRGEEVSAAAGQPDGVKATSSIDDVRRAFYDSLDGPEQYWWWIRQVLVNPFQLVVDDDDGGLYLIDVSVDGSDNITFGDPQSVKVEYVAATAADFAQMHKQGQVVMAAYGDRVAAGAKDKEGSTDGPSDDSTEEETDTVLTDEALRALGLEPGATQEQINAAILATATGGDGNGGEGGDGEDGSTVTTDTPGGGDPATTGQPTTPATQPTAQPTTTTDAATTTPAAPAIPEGMVLVDSEQWAVTQQGVAAALRIDKEQKASAKTAALNAAVMAGKFPRSRVDHYGKMWDADPDGTKVLLASMADGLVPVTERGVAGETDPQPEESAYPESWKRDPRVVAARNAVSTRVKVVND